MVAANKAQKTANFVDGIQVSGVAAPSVPFLLQLASMKKSGDAVMALIENGLASRKQIQKAMDISDAAGKKWLATFADKAPEKGKAPGGGKRGRQLPMAGDTKEYTVQGPLAEDKNGNPNPKAPFVVLALSPLFPDWEKKFNEGTKVAVTFSDTEIRVRKV